MSSDVERPVRPGGSGEETGRLVVAAQGGDRGALDRLLREHLPLVHNVAARTLGAADADDVTQETLIRALTGLRRLRQPTSFRSWLVAIALRETRRHGRRIGADRQRLTALDADDADERGGADDTAVHRVELSRQRRRMAAAARWLDAGDRELLNLWWLTEVGALERAELPRILGVSPAHARVRLHRLHARVESARRITEAVDRAGGPDGCPPLRELLRRWDGRPTPAWRKRLARHLDQCPRCRSAGGPLLPPERLLAAVPLLAPPAELADTVSGRLTAAGAAGAPAASRLVRAGAAVVAVLVVALGVGVTLRDRPPQRDAAVAPPASPTAAPTPSLSPSARPRPPATVPAGPAAGAGIGGPTWPAGQLPPTTGRYLYVSGTGDDGNSGRSRNRPLRTLGRAAALTEPGDTVLVDDGEYREPDRFAVVAIERSGSPQKWITWAAHPGARPVVRATAWHGIWVHASYVTVSGFTITGPREELTAAQRAAARRGDVTDPALSTNCLSVSELRNAATPRRPHHVVVWGNTMTDCTLNGISTQFADHVTIAHNVTARNAWWSPYAGSGISVHSSWNSDAGTGVKMIVRGNVSHDNQNLVPAAATGRIQDGNGIIVESNDNRDVRGAPLFQTPYTGRTLVENNISYRNGGRGVNVYRAAHVDVVNNTLYRNAAHPDIEIDLTVTECRDVRVANSVVVAGPGSPAAALSRSTGVTFDHNLLVGRTLGVTDRALTSADPRFVDPGDADFRLAAGSPAVDSGTATGAPERDARRAARVGEVDRGALERR